MGKITLVAKDADFVAEVVREALKELNEALEGLDTKVSSLREEIVRRAGDNEMSFLTASLTDKFLITRVEKQRLEWIKKKDLMEKALILLYTGSEDTICPTNTDTIGGA